MVENFSLLEQAVERNTPIALVLPSAGLMKSYRSRLLNVDKHGVLLESVEDMSDRIADLVNSQEPIKISFRSDVRRVEFESSVIEMIRGHKLNNSTKINAILVRVPSVIKAVQRRNDYRATVPSDGELKFSFWKITETDDFSTIPGDTAKITVDVRDCSTGGIGGTWKRKTTEHATMADNQRLRIEIESPVGKCTLEARMRFLENLNDPYFKRVGIQFVINPNNLQDRQKIMYMNKLLSELQRMELRRKKIAR